MQPGVQPSIEPNAAITSRIAAFDLIRIFATFSVIVVHVATPIVRNNLPDNSLWYTGNLYHAIFRSGIPLFLMLTGALLLPRAIGLKFSFKRFLRVLFPFTFWTAIFLVAYNKITDLTISDFIDGMLNGVTGYYWYVYLIIPIYFLLPLIRKTILNSSLTAENGVIITSITIALWYAANLLLPAVTGVIEHIIYLEFVIVGYLLSAYKKESWLSKTSVNLIFIVAGIVATYLSTYVIISDKMVHIEFFYTSVNLAIFLKAIGLWFILQKLTTKLPDRVTQSISYVSRFTFAIFLMHPLVIDFILVSRLGFSLNFEQPGTGIFTVSLLCFVFAAIIAVLLSKLPFGKYTY